MFGRCVFFLINRVVVVIGFCFVLFVCLFFAVVVLERQQSFSLQFLLVFFACFVLSH